MDPRFARVQWIWVSPSLCESIFYNSIFLRIDSLVFLMSYMKLRNHKYSKLTQLNFLGKFLLVGKQAKIAPKWPIVSICPLHSISFRIFSLLLLLIFWHYAWSWGTISTTNWHPIFFEKFVLARNWVKRPRIAQFVHKFVNTAFFSKLAN